jgi:hypothetical protein
MGKAIAMRMSSDDVARLQNGPGAVRIVGGKRQHIASSDSHELAKVTDSCFVLLCFGATGKSTRAGGTTRGLGLAALRNAMPGRSLNPRLSDRARGLCRFLPHTKHSGREVRTTVQVGSHLKLVF